MRKSIIYILAIMLLGLGVQATDVPPSGADDAAAADFGVHQPPDDFYAQMDPDQPPPDGPPPFGPMIGQPPFGPGPKQFERFRLNKLLELLELEDDQKEKFVEIMEGQRDQRFKWMHAFMSTVDTLSDGLRSGEISNDEIDVLVERLDQLEVAKLENAHKFHAEVKSVLNPKQFGKLLIFEIRFESEILGKVNEFHRRRGGMPPGGRRFPGAPGEGNDKDSI